MDPMALVGVGDLISLVEILVGVGDLINCTRFAYICGFGNSWRFQDTRSTMRKLFLHYSINYFENYLLFNVIPLP